MESQKNGHVDERKKRSRGEELYEKWTVWVSRMFGDISVKERFLLLAGAVFTGIIAYFAAGKGIPFLPDGAGGGLSRPLGDAILCASGSFAPAAFVGLLYAAYEYSEGVIARIFSLCALFAVRTGIGIRACGQRGDFSGFYRENATVKTGSAAAFSLFTVGIRATMLPISAETLPELLSMLLLTPALTALLSGAFSGNKALNAVNHRVIRMLTREAATYFFYAVCVYSLKGHSFMGSSLASIAAIFLTVTAAVKGGVIRGGILGAALGFVLSPERAPILVITGLFAGTLSGLGIGATVGISCAAGCLLAVYAYGYRAILTVVPESIIATAITSPVIKYGFLSEGFPIPDRRLRRSGTVVRDREARNTELETNSIRRLAGVLKELSSSTQKWEHYKRQTVHTQPDGDYVCRRLKEGFCDSCPLVCVCWDNGSQVANAAVKTEVSRLYRSESPAEKSFRNGSSDRFRCVRPTEIKKEIARICESAEARASTLPPPPLGFFGDCLCISDALSDIAASSARRTATDHALTAKAKRAVGSLGVAADELEVFGKGTKTAVIYGADLSTVSGREEQIADAVSRACGHRFYHAAPLNTAENTDSEVRKSGRNRDTRVVFKSETVYSAEYAKLQHRANGEERNGDFAVGVTAEDGYFFSVLCDGMGSGNEAADCSESAAHTVVALLECGLSPRVASRLAGNAVKERTDECFTTLDLLAVDLSTGEGTVYKSGAVCSYFIRNGQVKQLSAPALPLGISYETEPEGVPVTFRDGDVLVMISDGMAQDETEELKIADRLALYHETEADGIAERLMNDALTAVYAKKESRQDDMTVVVVKIQLSDNNKNTR